MSVEVNTAQFDPGVIPKALQGHSEAQLLLGYPVFIKHFIKQEEYLRGFVFFFPLLVPSSSPILRPQLGVLQFNSILTLTALS